MANWDNEIDDAARQMTAGEPDAGFKTRVLARIAETGPRRGWSMWAWPGVAVTAAAMLALVMVRSPSRSGRGDTVRLRPDSASESMPEATHQKPEAIYDRGGSSAAAAGSVVSGTSVASGAGVAPGFPPSLRFGEARRRAERGGGSRTESAPLNDAMAQAGDIAPPPIEVDPIGMDSMDAMESIQLTTLAIARIDVPAIAEE